MAEKRVKSTKIGKTKISTDDMIEGAIARQNTWMSRRRDFAKRFLKKLNIFARSSNSGEKKARLVAKEARKLNRATKSTKTRKSGLMAYWFPILCAVVVLAVGVWVAFVRSDMNVVKENDVTVVVPAVPEPVVQEVKKETEKTDAKKLKKHSDLLISNIWSEYLRQPERPDSSDSTLHSYHKPLRLFIVWLRKQYPQFVFASELNAEIAHRFFMELWEGGISPGTYNRYLQALKLIFKHILIAGILDENPFMRISKKLKRVSVEKGSQKHKSMLFSMVSTRDSSIKRPLRSLALGASEFDA